MRLTDGQWTSFRHQSVLKAKRSSHDYRWFSPALRSATVDLRAAAQVGHRRPPGRNQLDRRKAIDSRVCVIVKIANGVTLAGKCGTRSLEPGRFVTDPQKFEMPRH